jgi:hypothetical protein
MASSLRDIPGANRRTSTFRRRREQSAALRPGILIDPRASLYDRGKPSRGGFGGGSRRPRPLRDPRRRRIATVDLLLGGAVLVIVAFLLWQLWTATRVDVDVTGIQDDGAITFAASEGLQIAIDVKPTGRLDNATLLLDGEDLGDVAERVETGFRWTTEKPLTAGMHQLELTVPRPILPAATFTYDFMVDAVPPRIEVPRTLLDPVGIDDPVRISGSVDTDATLTANGDEVELDDTGRFTVELDRAPAGPIKLVATDRAEQTSIVEVFVPVRRPMTRGVHMSAISWSTDDLREGVLDMVDRGVINTVELDIKDEGGEVGWDTSVALAQEIGAVKAHYDLREAIRVLKERDVYIIGRVVAFRDPILATAAWARGEKDWVLQDAAGNPHGAYGGFTNFMSDSVRKYNIDLALEAIDLGVDEILWDYVRRPEGDLASMRIPGLPANDSVEANIASFLAEAHGPLREAGALQGASVFGVAAQEPESIGQSVGLIAKTVDYIAPMVYPSLWGPSMYRVPNPVNQPYEIVTRSLDDFQNQTEGTGVPIIPWLQDFSLGAEYGAEEVREQVLAAKGLGIESWLLWSPRVRYHAELLEVIEKE